MGARKIRGKIQLIAQLHDGRTNEQTDSAERFAGKYYKIVFILCALIIYCIERSTNIVVKWRQNSVVLPSNAFDVLLVYYRYMLNE